MGGFSTPRYLGDSFDSGSRSCPVNPALISDGAPEPAARSPLTGERRNGTHYNLHTNNPVHIPTTLWNMVEVGANAYVFFAVHANEYESAGELHPSVHSASFHQRLSRGTKMPGTRLQHATMF